jgi:hypothetical protein
MPFRSTLCVGKGVGSQQGSLSEIDAQIEIARKLGYIDEQTQLGANERLSAVEQLLSGLKRDLTE